MKTFKELLKELQACNEAEEWVASMTVEEAIEKCNRGDWFLWLADKISVEPVKMILCGAKCIDTVRHLIKQEAIIKELDSAIAYGEGKISCLPMKTIKSLLSPSYAEQAIQFLYEGEKLAYCVSFAVGEEYFNKEIHNGKKDIDAYIAYVKGRTESLKNTADICRKYIGKEIIYEVNKLLHENF